MTKLLAFETATDRGSFCLWSAESAAGLITNSVRVVECPAGKPHAETLLPLLRQSLEEMGWALQDLDAVVYDAGPGMFTGLRVSAALAQGLGIGCGKPLIAISSLEVLAELAYAQSCESRILTMLDARMNQIYAAIWERQTDGFWSAKLSACLINPAELEKLSAHIEIGNLNAVAGTALDEYPEAAKWCKSVGLKDTGIRYPQAQALAKIGSLRLDRGELQDPADAIPVYVRDRVALTTAERMAGESL